MQLLGMTSSCLRAIPPVAVRDLLGERIFTDQCSWLCDSSARESQLPSAGELSLSWRIHPQRLREAAGTQRDLVLELVALHVYSEARYGTTCCVHQMNLCGIYILISFTRRWLQVLAGVQSRDHGRNA